MREILLNPANPEDYELDTVPVSSRSILQLELNFKTPDIETVELINDSEYLQRIDMLWGDSAEWL